MFCRTGEYISLDLYFILFFIFFLTAPAVVHSLPEKDSSKTAVARRGADNGRVECHVHSTLKDFLDISVYTVKVFPPELFVLVAPESVKTVQCKSPLEVGCRNRREKNVEKRLFLFNIPNAKAVREVVVMTELGSNVVA